MYVHVSLFHYGGCRPFRQLAKAAAPHYSFRQIPVLFLCCICVALGNTFRRSHHSSWLQEDYDTIVSAPGTEKIGCDVLWDTEEPVSVCVALESAEKQKQGFANCLSELWYRTDLSKPSRYRYHQLLMRFHFYRDHGNQLAVVNLITWLVVVLSAISILELLQELWRGILSAFTFTDVWTKKWIDVF